jgi:hypothetical protein
LKSIPESEEEGLDMENAITAGLDEDITETSYTVTTLDIEEETETTLTTLSGRSSGHRTGALGGINILLPPRPSLLASALDALSLPFVGSKKATAVPGDFEAVDRELEEQIARSDCLATIELKICPIEGLGFQQFRCHSCHEKIGINDYPEARLCDVSGFYFCAQCHQNQFTLSPARILQNWDFSKVTVSNDIYTQLGTQCRSDHFDVERINPLLFTYVDALQEAKLIREEILIYSKIYKNCNSEGKSEIYRRIWPRQHLIDSTELYSIEDLLEAKNGTLATELKDYRDIIKEHVLERCLRCRSEFNG